MQVEKVLPELHTGRPPTQIGIYRMSQEYKITRLVMVFIIDLVAFNLFVAAENVSLHFMEAFLFGPRSS